MKLGKEKMVHDFRDCREQISKKLTYVLQHQQSPRDARCTRPR